MNLDQDMLNGLYLGNDCEQRRTDDFPIFPSENAVELALYGVRRCVRWHNQAGWLGCMLVK
jgi:hypothetical protein